MAQNYTITKDSVLSYKKSGEQEYTKVEGMFSFPALRTPPNQVDVTTMDDAAYKYIKGLIEYGQLEFGIIYGKSDKTTQGNFQKLMSLEDEDSVSIKLTLPDGVSFTYDAQVFVGVNEGAINGRIECTLSTFLLSDIIVSFPQ